MRTFQLTHLTFSQSQSLCTFTRIDPGIKFCVSFFFEKAQNCNWDAFYIHSPFLRLLLVYACSVALIWTYCWLKLLNINILQTDCYIWYNFILNVVIRNLSRKFVVSVSRIIYIVTCRGVRVTKIAGSRLDDWIYWHFFAITINYYSSQTILTAEASLHSVSRVSDSLQTTFIIPFKTSTRTP
jgi:hypothetical protein